MAGTCFTIEDAPCCVFSPSHGDSMGALIVTMAVSNGWDRAPSRGAVDGEAVIRCAIDYLNGQVAPRGAAFRLGEEGFWLEITDDGWLMKFTPHRRYPFIRKVFVVRHALPDENLPEGIHIGYEEDHRLLFFDESRRTGVESYFIATANDIEVGYDVGTLETFVHEDVLRSWIERKHKAEE